MKAGDALFVLALLIVAGLYMLIAQPIEASP